MKTTPLFAYRAGFLVDETGAEIPVVGGQTGADSALLADGGAAFVGALRNKGDTLLRLTVRREQVEPEPACYDEAFLADLRTFLKEAEAQKLAVVLSMEAATAGGGAEEDGFIEAAAHLARRVKDCASVLGFSVPEWGDAAFKRKFAERFAKKHPFFVFFVSPRDRDFWADLETSGETAPFVLSCF